MVLTNTNISTKAYCQNRIGYEVTCSTERPTRARGYQGSVRVVTRERPIGWGIESTRYHGPNMIRCKLVIGLTRTPLFGIYLPLSTLEQLPDLEDALKRFKDPIAFGDLNVDLDVAMILRIQQVVELLADHSLLKLVRHFRQRHRLRNLKTWSQVRQVTVPRSRCDYILGTDRLRFELVGIRDMWTFSSDHFTLRARLLQCPNLCHDR